MATCNFCKETYQSEQGVKAHLKRCDPYQKSKKEPASGSVPQAASTPSAQPSLSARPECAAPLRDCEKAMHQFSKKQEAPQTSQQLRRSILQAVKAQVVDRYQSSSGIVTATMRGAAKMAIEQQLASLPLEELPFDEVCELAAAIRDRLYAPTFKRQALEAGRQDAEHESRRREQIEEMAEGHRAARRKTTLIEQAIGQAHARCEAQQIVGRDRLSVLVDIESQLKEFLTGNESVSDAHAIIQMVRDARLVEAEAKQAAARVKADAQWYENLAGLLVLGALVATPLLALRYPAQVLAIIRWLERIVGGDPASASGATAEASPPTEAAPDRAASPPSGRQRRRPAPVPPSSPESPWTNSVGREPGHA